MNFYEHTLNWFKGELFEGKLVFICGIVILILSLLLWKFGTTPNARALIVPMLVVGLLFSVGIGSMLIGYPKRMQQAQLEFKQDAEAFILAEKKRVEDFQVLYKYSVGFAAVSFLLTIIAFGFLENRTFQSICIAMLIVGVGLIVIDHFSKERARIYYNEIQNQLKANE